MRRRQSHLSSHIGVHCQHILRFTRLSLSEIRKLSQFAPHLCDKRNQKALKGISSESSEDNGSFPFFLRAFCFLLLIIFSSFFSGLMEYLHQLDKARKDEERGGENLPRGEQQTLCVHTAIVFITFVPLLCRKGENFSILRN